MTNNPFQLKTLGDVCQKITVGHVGTMASHYVDGGIPFLRSQNITPFSLQMEGVRKIPPAFHKRLGKSELLPGDVVVIRTGYPGTAAVIPKSLRISNCADLVVIRPEKNLDPWFLCSLFNSPWGKAMVSGNLVGAAQQHFNVASARQLQIPFPRPEIQGKIGRIAKTLAFSIENNTRRIKILESIAQTIYREWFVEFRYPGYEKVKMVDSTLGKIPSGWRIEKVRSLVERLKVNNQYTQHDVTPTGTVPVIDQSTAELLGYHDYPADLDASPDSPVIIFGDHTCKMELVIAPFSIGPNVVPFQSATSISVHYLYWLVNSLVETKEYKRHWSELMSKEVVVCTGEASNAFTQAIKPSSEAIGLHRGRNRVLRTLRDLLLPRLISGQLDVEDIEIDVDEAWAEASK